MGVVYSLPVTGGTPTILHSFSGADGNGPRSGLALVGSTFYGTTGYGGTYGDGNIYRINADGAGFQNLLSFTGTNGPISARPPMAI